MNPLLIYSKSATFAAMEDRINQLESLAALQDHTISQLNGEVFRQLQEIALLRKRIDALEDRLKQLEQPDEIAGDEPPPHW